MPPAAIIGGAAVLGAGASIVAGNKNAKAIEKSSDSSLQANRESIAAQERMAAQQLGLYTNAYNATGKLQTDIYNQQQQTLQPWAAGGFGAFNKINSMVGVPEQQAYTPQQVSFTPINAQPQPPATNIGPPPQPANSLMAPPAGILPPNAYYQGMRY